MKCQVIVEKQIPFRVEQLDHNQVVQKQRYIRKKSCDEVKREPHKIFQSPKTLGQNDTIQVYDYSRSLYLETCMNATEVYANIQRVNLCRGTVLPAC